MESAVASPKQLEWRKDQVPQELWDLRCHIDQLPLYLRMKLMPLCDRLGHFSRLQTKLVKIAQDTVDQLQTDVKYLLFDVEATRREKDALRRKLAELEEFEDEEEE